MAAFDRLGPTESLPTDGVPLEQICKNAGLSAELGAEAIEYLVSEGFLFCAWATDDDQADVLTPRAAAADETMYLPTNCAHSTRCYRADCRAEDRGDLTCTIAFDFSARRLVPQNR